jgi:site-specific DNA-methyltransferase (adenine-specific)
MDSIRLHHCAFQQLERIARIAPGTVQAVITDIPYIKEFLPELPALAAMASRVLVDGGIFATYSGQYHLPKVMAAFGEYLTWGWAAATFWQGRANVVRPRNVFNRWKPILVYTKGKWRKRRFWEDVLSRPDGFVKRWHKWEQPLSESERLVRAFTKPGDLVLDPCGGGFTVAIACYRTGRRFIGCDIDGECVQNGHQRLAEQRADRKFFLGELAFWLEEPSFRKRNVHELAQDTFDVHLRDLPQYLADLSEYHQALYSQMAA